MRPTQYRGKPRDFFLGYVKDLHYVSTVCHALNVNVLKYLKRKLSESEDQHEKRLQRKRLQYVQTSTAKKPCTQDINTATVQNRSHDQNSNIRESASRITSHTDNKKYIVTCHNR